MKDHIKALTQEKYTLLSRNQSSTLRLYYLTLFVRFTGKKIGENRHCLHPLVYTYTTSLMINITHQNGTFVTKDETILTHPNQPKPIVHLKFHSVLYILWAQTNVP